jgi:hypothetical protein
LRAEQGVSPRCVLPGEWRQGRPTPEHLRVQSPVAPCTRPL